MEFETAIATGNYAALQLAKTMLTQPALIFQVEDLVDNDSVLPFFYIPIESPNVSMRGDAEVSENVIIATSDNEKKYLTDNIAPGPWVWSINGYIPGNATELTNYFTPFVRFNTDLIKAAFKRGVRMRYKDTDCRIYTNVVIQSAEFMTQADCQNKQPVNLTLKQIEVMATDNAFYTQIESISTPDTGSIGGPSKTVETTPTQQAGKTDLRRLSDTLKLTGS